MRVLDLHRWERDSSEPSKADAARDLLRRAILPMLVPFVALILIGKLIIMGALDGAKGEMSVNVWFEEHRTPLFDALTWAWSRIGNTEVVIGVCLIVCFIVWRRTKQWWYAVTPIIAITLQLVPFVLTTVVVGRERPDVTRMDPGPPTSSFPSGHVGAPTSLYLTFALMAQQIETTWLRRLITVVCLAIPFLVAFARVYRGMHHVSDVTFGFLNGLICALLAWQWLRRRGAREGRDT